MNIGIILSFQIIYFVVCLHYFQWKGYFKKRYLKYLFKNKLIIILNIILFVQIIFNLLKISNFYLNLFCFILNIFILILLLLKPKKIKFIFTKRICRLLILNLALILMMCFTTKYLMFGLSVLTPIMLVALDWIDWIKYIEHNKFLSNAINKLNNNKNLITIGITGSNGKTSVKEILKQLLSSKYVVVSTSGNQNTLKGAMLAINQQVSQNTEIFICEMGARCKGDIQKICTLTNPTKAIVTSLSPQHLETFKNISNIYNTKKELPDYIKDGFCVYNTDNYYIRKMYGKKNDNKSAVSVITKSDLYASNIHISNFKTYFDINYNGNVYPCHTNLLGEHNVTNILLALNMALHLGIDINSAVQIIIGLPSTPHRLQYLKSHVDIIDDSYNCSISSARMALKVLSQINKTKVVCTPGIIEGGKCQFDLNLELSGMLSTTADIIIIVGKTNRKALISRLYGFELIYVNNPYSLLDKISGKFITKINNIPIAKINLKDIFPSTKKRAYIVDTLNIAKRLFTKILNQSHALLLLNDLPDEYN